MSRMVANYDQEVETTKAIAALMDEPSDQVVFRWRRLTIMVGLVDMHASSGSIMSHLELMRDRIAEDARRAYEKAAGAKATVTKKTVRGHHNMSNKEATAVGKPLPRSTTGSWIYDPELCTHARLEPRGNKNLLWFTCLKCGSRWERVFPTAPATDPQTPSRSAAPPASAVAASGPVVKMDPAPSMIVVKSSPVDKKKVTFVDSNQKRKTEDFQMVGFSALGQRVYERYQELTQNADVPHEVVVQKLMSLAQSQEEIAGVMEVIQSLKGS